MACLEGIPVESLFFLKRTWFRLAKQHLNKHKGCEGVMIWVCFVPTGPRHLAVNKSSMNFSVHQSNLGSNNS